MLAELPPVVKALSGIDLQDLIDKLPDLAVKSQNKRTPPTDGAE